MNANDYDAVVFDNDGVLIEPTDVERLAEAVRRSFDEFDVVPDESVVRRSVEEDWHPFQVVDDEYGLDPDEWWPRREAIAATVQREEIRTGRKALYDDVDALGDLDHSLGVVSNNQHETIEFILDYHGLGDRFETCYGRDPTVAGANARKPDPHYLERALADLGTNAVLYVGDSETDIVAAERAGIDSAFLRREHRSALALSVEPTCEFPDLRTLVDGLTDPSTGDGPASAPRGER